MRAHILLTGVDKAVEPLLRATPTEELQQYCQTTKPNRACLGDTFLIGTIDESDTSRIKWAEMQPSSTLARVTFLAAASAAAAAAETVA